jgi:hypothetical protein
MSVVSSRWGWKCEKCIKEYRREWARKRRELGLPSGGSAPKEWWIEYYKKYYSRPEVKKHRAELMKKYSNDPKLRMKHEARWQAHRAFKRGDIIKLPCRDCGDPKSEMHHPNYYEPLKVIWLCRKHHLIEHKSEGKA